MITTAYANKILGVLFGLSDSLALPDYVYLGFSSTEPKADGSGITEPSAESYKRVLVSGNKTSATEKKFTTATDGVIKNTSEIICSTARESWGVLPYWFLSTSSTTGITGSNIILTGNLTGKIATEGVAAETVPVFYEGELQASIDVDLSAAAE